MTTPSTPGGEPPPKRPLTVEDLWAIKRPGQPSFSPDGRRIAVSFTSFDMESGSRSSDIWILSADESAAAEPLRLTTHTAADRDPRWSPDGRSIAFVSQRDGDEQNQVYLISPEGGEASRLTTIPTGVSALKWFPDGKRLAFISWVWPDLSSDEDQAARLKERREAKVQAFAVETTHFRYWDRWHADGREPHLFCVDVESGEHRDLLAGTPLSLYKYQVEAGLTASLYDIAPDGSEVALTVDLSSDPGFDTNADIVILPLDGGEWKNITSDNPAYDGDPRYSPDGRWLAYVRKAIPHFYADRDRLVLYDRSTGARGVLTEEWDRSASPPLWSPDGQQLLFTAEDQAREPLWVLGRGDHEPGPLLNEGTHTCVELSRDGSTLAFVRATMDSPPRVFAAGADGSNARPVESLNQGIVEQWELGPVEEMHFAGHGNARVQTWVIFPPGFDPGKKWPLLQIVHGGPHGAWRDEFHFRWNMHAFAARGYVVAAVNFHGSTGWGQAFTDANTGSYGEKEFADVEAATDALLETGYIDAERLAAAGGSFGGYMVAWMNGHTDRYRAYVCHAGVYNWISQMASDSVRGRERALGAFPWDDPVKVLEQSAHTYAKSFKTPTLVVHCEQDYRVPVTQGFEYYSTLRMLGVPSRLLYFPDENHWVLKPQNSRLWYQEFFDWIGRFVPPGPTGG